jgi:PAS domain S-box-containing protein
MSVRAEAAGSAATGSTAGLTLSVMTRHLPTVIAFAAATTIVAAAPGTHLDHTPSLLAGVGIEVLATVIAAWSTRRHPRHDPALDGDSWVLVVPLLSVLAIGFFRVGTGGATSVFTPMLVLPVVWIATEPGRRYAAVAALATSLALALPFLLGRAEPGGREVWRTIFGPFVYALAALAINEVARQVRSTVVSLRASEARLRAADRLTRSVLDAVTEQAVIGTDGSGLIQVWNPGAAALLGPAPAETQGRRSVLEFIDPQEIAARPRPAGGTAFDALVGAVGPGRAEVREWTWLRQDGSTVPVLVACTARQDETERVVGYLFVAADQTQVHEAERVKNEFVGTVSHELRTPVSAVLGHLDLLRDDPLTEDQDRYIDVAERNARRLLRLVNDLLFTAQVDAGGVPLDLSDVDLRTVIAASVESAAPAGRRAGVAIVADLPERVPPVRGDTGRLGQAVDNLISNAVKFTPSGGSVTVTLSAGPAPDSGDDEVTVAVADTGIGVPAEELDRLFGRFFRASTAVRHAVPGVGLGLTITRAIVRAHGGGVTVTSAEGVGTTFTLHLPVASAGGVPEYP